MSRFWAERRDRVMVERYTENVGHPPETLYPSGPARAQWDYPRVQGVKVPRRNDERFVFVSALTRKETP